MAQKICVECARDVTGRSRMNLPTGAYVCGRCKRRGESDATRQAALRRQMLWAGVLALVAVLIALMLAVLGRAPRH